MGLNITSSLLVIQPTISVEMPVPSQGHYGFHSFPVVYLSVYILMCFDFPFGRLFGVREFCYYPYLHNIFRIK